MQVLSLLNIWESEYDKILFHVIYAIFKLKLLSGYFSSIKWTDEGTWLKLIMKTGWIKDLHMTDIQ